jgi:hypothetical protein
VFLLAVAVTSFTIVVGNGESLPRQVSCAGTQSVIPPGAADLYSLGIDRSELNFGSLASMAMTTVGGADLGEFLNIIDMAKNYTNTSDGKIPVTEINTRWNASWAQVDSGKRTTSSRPTNSESPSPENVEEWVSPH